jgi:hypothetical protein
LSKLSHKLKKELMTLDFSKIKKDKLISMIISCDPKISELIPKIDFMLDLFASLYGQNYLLILKT